MAEQDEMRRDLVLDGLTLVGGIVANIVAAGLGDWSLWISAPLVVGCTVSVIVLRRRLRQSRLTAQRAAIQLRAALLKFWRSEAKNLGNNDGRRLSVRWVRDHSTLFDSDDEIADWGRRVALLRVPSRAEPGGGLAGRDEELESVWLERAPAGRLVLVGAGGSGKTDLLIAAMERLTGQRASESRCSFQVPGRVDVVAADAVGCVWSVREHFRELGGVDDRDAELGRFRRLRRGGLCCDECCGAG